jgi:short-subunit dehydrogenase
MSVAIVTGASSGIGEATARRLDRDGWRLILVARRGDKLESLAGQLRDARALPLDLTGADAPERAREAAESEGSLELLVNNAGAAWMASFGDADGGYENVRRTMEVNFDAVVRLTEALLPLLRRSAPSSIVNVSSTAGRVGRPGVGAYSASKYALAGWSECLQHEERQHGVHVGLVLPGFVATEGFPQEQLLGSARTRWIVSTPEKVAEAILATGPGGKAERYVPRPYGLVPAFLATVPALVRRVTSGMRR